MSWGFFWGVIIGTCLGFLIAGLVSAAHDNKDYIVLNIVEEKEKEKENEVEE